MYVVREIVYAFLLVALLHSLVLCVEELTALLHRSEELFAQAYRWQRCGRMWAARANLQASIATIRHYYPELSAEQKARLADAMHNFHHNYPETGCAEIAAQIEVYRQDNDQLPEFWPNYAFRRQK